VFNGLPSGVVAVADVRTVKDRHSEGFGVSAAQAGKSLSVGGEKADHYDDRSSKAAAKVDSLVRKVE
jgi:hypothetical protein